MGRTLAALILLVLVINSQAQLDKDSLLNVWNDPSIPFEERIEAVWKVAWDVHIAYDLDSAYKYADIALQASIEEESGWHISKSLNIKGVVLHSQGNILEGISLLQKAIMVADSANIEEMAMSYSMGLAYNLNNIGQHEKAIALYRDYLEFHKSFGEGKDPEDHFRSTGKSHCIALLNLATTYKDIDSLDLALATATKGYEQIKKYIKIAHDPDPQQFLMECHSLRAIGEYHHLMGEQHLSVLYLDTAIARSKRIEFSESMADAKAWRAEAHYALGELDKSRNDAEAAIDLNASPFATRLAHNRLYVIYRELHEPLKALEHYEAFHAMDEEDLRQEIDKQLLAGEYERKAFSDSLVQEQQKMELRLAHQEEVAQKDKTRNMLMGGGLLLLLLAGGLFSRNRYVSRSKKQIQKEKDRSEELLLNILPEEVAEELKDKGEAEAQLIDQVTVLFTDFKGFTAMSEQLSPKELVNDLNLCFSEFDRITAKYSIEKIKTIGDAYMAAGGLPTPNNTHATDVIKAALEMRDFVDAGKARKIEAGLPYFEIRIGVHTGPVVAGIVGVKKFQYDIWGDTVNTASRMESSGEVGQVNISEATYKLVNDNSEFDFTSRGKVEAKGKGEMEMYFVS